MTHSKINFTKKKIMSKNVIHNFNIAIKNIQTIKSSEDLKEIFLKELVKVSIDMSQEKDIVQLWQEYHNNNGSNLSNQSTKKIESNTALEKIKNPIFLDTTVPILKKTKQDSNITKAVSESPFFIRTDNTNRKSIDYLTANNIIPTILKGENISANLNNGLTPQIYTNISTQQILSIPSKTPLPIDNESYSDIIKTEIRKKFTISHIENDIDLTNYISTISKDFYNKKDKDHFAEEINIETKKETDNLYKISETSINNLNWKKLSESLIFKLSELSKEEKNIYLKEYYDILIKKITKPNINIQELFAEYDELFLLLKSLFPGLPEKITIQTQRIIYPHLGIQKMYPEIGVRNMYFRTSGALLNDINYKSESNKKDSNQVTDEFTYSNSRPLIDIFDKDPIHHEFLINIAIKIYNQAKAKGASVRGAMLITSQATLESGWGTAAERRGDYNLFGTSTNGNDYKVKNSQIKIKDYSNVGGYDASIKDYFTSKFKKWPGIEKVIKNENFTEDDLDKAFYTGIYIEDEKTRNKTGHGAYNFDDVITSKPNGRGTITSNNNKYGKSLLLQIKSTTKRLVQSIDYEISKNNALINQETKKLQSNNLSKKEQEHLSNNIDEIQAQNERYLSIKNDIKKE